MKLDTTLVRQALQASLADAEGFGGKPAVIPEGFRMLRNGGVHSNDPIVITAGAGVGKSTFVSWITDPANAADVSSWLKKIAHHSEKFSVFTSDRLPTAEQARTLMEAFDPQDVWLAVVAANFLRSDDGAPRALSLTTTRDWAQEIAKVAERPDDMTARAAEEAARDLSSRERRWLVIDGADYDAPSLSALGEGLAGLRRNRDLPQITPYVLLRPHQTGTITASEQAGQSFNPRQYKHIRWTKKDVLHLVLKCLVNGSEAADRLSESFEREFGRIWDTDFDGLRIPNARLLRHSFDAVDDIEVLISASFPNGPKNGADGARNRHHNSFDRLIHAASVPSYDKAYHPKALLAGLRAAAFSGPADASMDAESVQRHGVVAAARTLGRSLTEASPEIAATLKAVFGGTTQPFTKSDARTALQAHFGPSGSAGATRAVVERFLDQAADSGLLSDHKSTGELLHMPLGVAALFDIRLKGGVRPPPKRDGIVPDAASPNAASDATGPAVVDSNDADDAAEQRPTF